MNINKKGLIILLIIISIVSPYLFTRPSLWFGFDEYCGVIGDTIGGITAPFIGLLSIFLLYWTLQEQQTFNEKQRLLLVEEQFKSTFFDLLKQQTEIRNRFIDEKYDVFSICKKELASIYDALDNWDKYIGLSEEELETEKANIESVLAEAGIDEHNHEDFISINYKLFMIKKISNYRITQETVDIYNSYTTAAERNRKAFVIFYTHYNNDAIGFYFRHLYWILKFLDKHIKELGEETVKEYAQFIQSQMGNKELLIVYYDSFAFSKMKDRVIFYNLLENLTIQNLISPSHNCEEYNLKNRDTLFL